MKLGLFFRLGGIGSVATPWLLILTHLITFFVRRGEGICHFSVHADPPPP